MTHLAWVHSNCKFVQDRNERVWRYLSSLNERWDFGPLPKLAAPASVGMYDVVIIRGAQVGESKDNRPAVVTRVLGNGMYEVVPVTSQFGLGARYSNPGDFALHMEHQDFSSTGLRKPSIIKDMPITVSNVMKIGHLSGEMLADFLDHTGREPAPKPQPVAAPPRQPSAPPRPQPAQPPVLKQPSEMITK